VPRLRSPGRLSGRGAALDAAVHAWGIAVATGQPSRLTPPLAHAVRPVAVQLVEPLRACRYYGPAIQPTPGADETVLLLNYLGRRENWTP